MNQAFEHGKFLLCLFWLVMTALVVRLATVSYDDEDSLDIVDVDDPRCLRTDRSYTHSSL